MDEKRKKTFAEQISDVLNGTYPKGESVLVREETPFILRQVGFRNLPMLTSQKHITDAVHPKSDKNPHLHGLTVEILNEVPACLESPVMILDSLTNSKSIVVLTNKLDGDGLPIIVSIRADGNGMFNHVDIDSNYITGYYGKNEFGGFLERNLESGNVIYWDKEKSQALLDSIQLQLPQALISLDSDTIIRKSKAFVNSSSEKNIDNTKKEGENMSTREFCIFVDTQSRDFRKLAKTIEKTNKKLDDGLGNVLEMFAAVKAKRDFEFTPVLFGSQGSPIKVKAGQEMVFTWGEKAAVSQIYGSYNGFEVGNGLDVQLKGLVDDNNQFKSGSAQNEYFLYSEIKNNELVMPFNKQRIEESKSEESESAAEVDDKGVYEKTVYQSARERVQQVRDNMVQTLLDYIEQNPTEWQSGWNNIAAGAPYNGKTNTAYRGINSLYLAFLGMARGYKDPRWVTFNQAKDLGASVKKGEKSSPVVFFEMYDRATKKAFDSKTVKDMTEEEKKAYIKENVYAVLKYSSVFNAEQCHNFPERNLDSLKMSEEERSNHNAMLETIIENSAAPVLYDGGNRAYYSPGTDKIHLPVIEAFDSMQDYYATALHEIAHSTGHQSRLNRDMSGGFGSESYAKEELRAELACVFMQIEHGIQLEGKHIENHAAYLNSWLEAAKKDKSVFFKAATDAQKIADYVEENYLQSVNTSADVLETAITSDADDDSAEMAVYNPMKAYLQAETAKRDEENRTLELLRAEGDHEEKLNQNIRQWYATTYPNDEAVEDISSTATFNDLQNTLNKAKSDTVYAVLGNDSVVRERAFTRLAELTNTTYGNIYDTWINDGAKNLDELQIKARAYGVEVQDKLLAARNEARRLAQDTGEPYVTIEYTEKMDGFPDINAYDVMPLSKADKKFAQLDFEAQQKDIGYIKTKLHIDFVFEGKLDSYENCRFDSGSEHGGLVHHIDEFLKYDTFLDADERAEAEAALEYFKRHIEVSEYLASPEKLAELSEEEQGDVNIYVAKARNVLNTSEPFSDYYYRMPLKPEEVKNARDIAHAAGLPFYEGTNEEWEDFDAAGGLVYDGNMSVDDYNKMWELREQEEARKREEQIAREDFPNDFEDEFTEALIDTVEDGTFLAGDKGNHEEKMTVEKARNAMLDAHIKDIYHYAVNIENVPYTDPDDGYESEEPAQNVYIIQNDGRVELWRTYPFDAYIFADEMPYGRNRSYEKVELEELEKIAAEMREPIETYKNVLRAEKEQTETRRRSDAYYEQRATDIIDEHYNSDGEFVRNLENPRYLNGTLYANETRNGYPVLSITKDENNRNIAIVKRSSDFTVAVGYDTDDGTWQKGHYDFANQNAAEEFRAKEYPAKEQTTDVLKSYEKLANSNSPIGQNYAKIKTEHPDSIIFYRIGDFYEVLGVDAERAATALDLTLTSRMVGTEKQVPMAGVPFHKIEEYAAMLADKGENAVIADDINAKEIKAVTPQATSDKSTIADELSKKSVWLKINLPKSSVGGQYGNNTMIKMPDGEYAHYALFIPTKFIKENNGKTELRVGADFTYRISNDGRQVELTGRQLQDSFSGVQIGKEYKRVAPSRKYAQVLANLEKNVPAELKEIPTWCCYRTRWNAEKGKKDKYIISPQDGKWASSKEPEKWVSFDAALKYARENNCEGLSVLLDKKYGITCIDLDKCLLNAQTGEMKTRATKLVEALSGTYIERSTSGNGLHIFVKDDILKNGTYNSQSMVKDEDPRGDLEVFDDKRIMSLTGDKVSKNNELTRAGSAATVYLRQELGERRSQASSGVKKATGNLNLSDNELISWIQRSKKGSTFNDLYQGRGVSGDKSADDAKLAHMLLYFNGGDKEQAFRIMRESALNRQNKPDSYYRATIDKMNDKIDVYAKHPNSSAGATGPAAGANNKKRGNQA